MSCVWARLPDRFSHYAWTVFRLHWVQGVSMSRCKLPSVLLAKWPGSFTCYCGYTAMERTPKNCQDWRFREENSPTAPAGTQTCNLSITSPPLYQQAIPSRNNTRYSQPPVDTIHFLTPRDSINQTLCSYWQDLSNTYGQHPPHKSRHHSPKIYIKRQHRLV